MKKLLFLPAITTLLFCLSSCKQQDEVVPSTSSAPLVEINPDICDAVALNFIAGQHINAGNIIVNNNETDIIVTYYTTNGWTLLETHLYVGSFEGIPVNNNGNPKIGNFPYKEEHIGNVTSYSYTIPISSLNNEDCVVIAAHASVGLVNEQGQIIQQETAWSEGSRISLHGSWAMFSNYCICNGGSGGGGGGGVEG